MVPGNRAAVHGPPPGDEFGVAGVDRIGGVVGLAPVIFSVFLGGSHPREPPLAGVSAGRISSTWGAYAAAHHTIRAVSGGGTLQRTDLLGNSVGAIGWFRGSLAARCGGFRGPGNSGWGCSFLML